MMNPADLQPPEEDLTAGLFLWSTDPSTVVERNGAPASLSAPAIAIVVSYWFLRFEKVFFVCGCVAFLATVGNIFYSFCFVVFY